MLNAHINGAATRQNEIIDILLSFGKNKMRKYQMPASMTGINGVSEALCSPLAMGFGSDGSMSNLMVGQTK